jgi:hypothetical protein
MIIFVGSAAKPSYMVETVKNVATIYQPDKHSMKEEDFFERYSLGIAVGTIEYKNIIFLKNKPIKYKYGTIVPELILCGKDYVLVNKKITVLPKL